MNYDMIESRKSPSPFDWPEGDIIHTSVRIDGNAYFVEMQLDLEEHRRRSALGLGAVISTGLLYALWELPYGVGIPREKLSSLDCETLDNAGNGWTEAASNNITRCYQPPGKVHSIAITDRSLARAVQRVATHPPTTKRLAIWLASHLNPSPRTTATMERAQRLGIGVISSDGSVFEELITPADAAIGRPAVFRWWQAELAYRNWLTRIAPTVRAATTDESHS